MLLMVLSACEMLRNVSSPRFGKPVKDYLSKFKITDFDFFFIQDYTVKLSTKQYSPVRHHISDRYRPTLNVALHRKRHRHRAGIHQVSHDYLPFCRLRCATSFCRLPRNRKTDLPFCHRRICLRVWDKPLWI